MDVTAIASGYAGFGGGLVGFAFAGLSFFVTRPPRPRSGIAADVLIPRQPTRRNSLTQINASAVATSGFYSMTSLGITTFLYANLSGTGRDAPAAQVGTDLLVYGAVFGLSVLTLFYFMTLILFENPLTRPAAKPAFWAGTIAASIVALRFVAGTAQGTWLAICSAQRPPCHPGAPYTTRGIFITLLAATLLAVVITLTRALERRPVRWLFAPFERRPSLPSACVFVTSVAVATMASLYINTQAVPPGWFISASYVTGVALIVVFALTSGSVIYPRLNGTRLTGPADSREAESQAAPRERVRDPRLAFRKFHDLGRAEPGRRSGLPRPAGLSACRPRSNSVQPAQRVLSRAAHLP